MVLTVLRVHSANTACKNGLSEKEERKHESRASAKSKEKGLLAVQMRGTHNAMQEWNLHKLIFHCCSRAGILSWRIAWKAGAPVCTAG